VIVIIIKVSFTVVFHVVVGERSLDWNEIVGKSARGKNNADLGQVKAVGRLNVMVQKGSLIKETYYLPKYLVQDYNGQMVWFNVSEVQLKDFEKERPPVREDYEKYKRKDMPGVEAVIPVLEERLQVSKTNVTEEVVIVKEPVVEYKLISVPVMREEIKIVRKPIAAKDAENSSSRPDAGNEGEVRILLNREEVTITKKPYLYEEVIIRKEKVMDTTTVKDVVIKEQVTEEEAPSPPPSRHVETV
jgi:uncharacterized protein (TIGR02271 family)